MTQGWVKDHKTFIYYRTVPLIPTKIVDSTETTHDWQVLKSTDLSSMLNIILLKVYTQKQHLRLGTEPVSNWNDLTTLWLLLLSLSKHMAW